MIRQQPFMQHILALDVLDTHTHLVGDRLCAQDFWEIAHYFWFFREMQAAGYPDNAAELPEERRISAFLDAYRATRNTNMNWAVTHIFRNLYDIEIVDERSVREADARVREASKRQAWAQDIADKLRIRRFVVNRPEHVAFQGTTHPAILAPRIDSRLFDWAKQIEQAADPVREGERLKAAIGELFDRFKQDGCPGIMTTLPRINASANRSAELSATGNARDEIFVFLLHAISEAAAERGLFVQLFLGVERTWSQAAAAPANDPERVLKLHGLFEQYPACSYELVVASEINNLDVVQAAWNFPNVHVGGMWWFNFRASTYRQSMQYRLEALPARQSSIVVSDARCMEWSYGKILLVKRLLGEFLHQQIEAGWLDRETALQVAGEWLYGSAARRYGVE